MFDLIIKEAASRFGLGDKAGPLVQMLVAYMTNKDTGGLSGFMNLFKSKGLGDIASSWLGGNGATAQSISGHQIENVLGGKGGLVDALASKANISSSTATSALGYLLPSVLGKLTPGGTVPTTLTQDVMSFANEGRGLLGGLLGAATGAAATGAKVVGNAASTVGHTAEKAGGGLLRWLPWIIAAAIGLWLLKSCTGVDATKAAADATKATAGAAVDATKATAGAVVDATKATAEVAKDAVAATGGAVAAGAAAVINYLEKAPDAVAGAPVSKVYFETGKIDLPADTGATIKPLIDYVKANAGTKAAISGFHDATGDKATNEELAKNRAKMVREQLRAAGFAEDQILMVKPYSSTGTGDNKEARRVELTVVK